jgi:uncharacterized Zn finger protein
VRTWGDRWRAALLEGGGQELERRVRQGVATQRSGRVGDVRVGIGRVTGRVQGSRATPFLVELEVPVLEDRAWEVLLDLVASTVRHSARLLAGQHPEGLEEAAAAAGVELFPRRRDVGVAAGHSGEDPFPVAGAALWEAVAVRLDASPFPLLQLRGRGRERVLRDVAVRRRAARGEDRGGRAAADVPVLGWSLPRAPLEAVVVPAARPPRLSVPGLRVLGEPDRWAGALGPADLLGPMVVDAADAAADLLAGRDPAEQDA